MFCEVYRSHPWRHGWKPSGWNLPRPWVLGAGDGLQWIGKKPCITACNASQLKTYINVNFSLLTIHLYWVKITFVIWNDDFFNVLFIQYKTSIKTCISLHNGCWKSWIGPNLGHLWDLFFSLLHNKISNVFKGIMRRHGWVLLSHVAGLYFHHYLPGSRNLRWDEPYPARRVWAQLPW